MTQSKQKDQPMIASLPVFKVGDLVKYVPYHAEGNTYHEDCEIGRVTSVRNAHVFVRFKGETSEGCNPDQLVKC